ncbi:MAG: tRNA pseudouridine(38-40) synthase TruA [Coriobacteriia bacterium]|nr:tRNA pseudouridine(38-40) synthase TruA [Coriobacteriia bacterium]
MSESRTDSLLAIAVEVAYDGAPFSGFARQPGLDTVQGRLESALATILRREVVTTGAGRTDAGVHALGQVVSFDARGDEPNMTSMRRSLEALSGEGIAIRGVRAARPGFSARFDALAREYRYRIVSGPVEPLFLDRFAWHVPSTLDVEAMAASAAILIGEHDFRSFTVSDSVEGKTTMRRIEALQLTRETQLGEECLMIRVVGNAFLHSMVRVIVGSLVEIGVGRRDPEWLEAALAARERSAAGPTAPAFGLVLHAVSYPDSVWL